MGSASNSNPWAPPNAAFRDCSQGICSIYCPQWCYIIYSPPPPSFILADDDSSAFEFSPFIVAVIGILASTFILVITYYTIISRLCRRHRRRRTNDDPTSQSTDEIAQASSGLDETLIKSITVCKYQKGGGGGGGLVVDGSDCCVCLGEFQENESLRLLPKCNHAFHLPCIDTWLKSHSTCPLCRSNIDIDTTTSMEAAPTSITINALEYQQRRSDVINVQSSQQPCLQQQVLVISLGSSRGIEGC